MIRGHLPQIYQEDLFLKELEKAFNFLYRNITEAQKEISDQLYADTATWQLPSYEKELLLNQDLKPLNERREMVEAYWKRGGKVGIEEIQQTADSFRGGAVRASFEAPNIIISFIDDYGVPSDLEGFKKVIATIAPAHLEIIYKFKYLLIRDIHNARSISEMEQTKISLLGGA